MSRKLSRDEINEIKKISDVNKKKDVAQNIVLKDWVKIKKGCLEAFTSYGKSYLLLKTVALFNKQKPDASILIIVPSLTLQDDILKDLKKQNLKADVFVVNTLANQLVKKEIVKEYTCVIADEVHRLCGESSVYFSQVLLYLQYEYFLGLSATLSESDKKYLNKHNLDIFFSISLEDGIKCSMVPEFSIWNIPVQMTEEEKKEYIKIQKQYNSIISQFSMHDLNNPTSAITACLGDKKTKVKYEGIVDYSEVHAERIGNSLNKTKGQTIGLALIWRNIQTQRRLFLNNCKNSIIMTYLLMNKIEGQILVFCSSIEICNLLHQKFSDSVVYHSKISKTKRDKNKEEFANKTKRIMLCVNSMKEGANFPSLRFIIRQGFTSQSRDTVQIGGRILRWDKNNPDKQSHLLHVYIEDFIDEEGIIQKSQNKKWLQSGLRGRAFVNWLENINELKI